MPSYLFRLFRVFFPALSSLLQEITISSEMLPSSHALILSVITFSVSHILLYFYNTCFPIQCREARKLKKQKLMVCIHPFFQNGAICKAFKRTCLTHILTPILGLLLHQHTCSCLWNLSFLMCQFLTTH